jgi:hypothetical protein
VLLREDGAADDVHDHQKEHEGEGYVPELGGYSSQSSLLLGQTTGFVFDIQACLLGIIYI